MKYSFSFLLGASACLLAAAIPQDAAAVDFEVSARPRSPVPVTGELEMFVSASGISDEVEAVVSTFVLDPDNPNQFIIGRIDDPNNDGQLIDDIIAAALENTETEVGFGGSWGEDFYVRWDIRQNSSDRTIEGADDNIFSTRVSLGYFGDISPFVSWFAGGEFYDLGDEAISEMTVRGFGGFSFGAPNSFRFYVTYFSEPYDTSFDKVFAGNAEVAAEAILPFGIHVIHTTQLSGTTDRDISTTEVAWEFGFGRTFVLRPYVIQQDRMVSFIQQGGTIADPEDELVLVDADVTQFGVQFRFGF